jgi:hypothetical protein
MNKIDCYVVEVTGEPQKSHDVWSVPVILDCYGRKSETKVSFFDEQKARNLSKGDKVVR